MSNSRDRKSSLFPANTTIPSGSSFTFFNSGVNYQISDDNFINALGVTGTIVQDGAVTGTAILDTQGTVNNIRNLENGAGIITSVSPENGATISHNFANGDSGINMIQGITDDQPVIPSLQQGTGIDLSLVDDHIVVTATGVITSSKTVLVNVLGDFPAPIAGVITLSDDTEYLISNDVDIGVNTFEQGDNCAFKGTSSTVITLTCTKGSGFLFSATGNTTTIENIRIAATGMSLINFDGSGIGSIMVEHLTLLGLTSTGTYTDTTSIVINRCFSDGFVTGMTFAGANGVALISNNLALSCSGPYLDLGSSTLTSCTLSGNIVVSGASGTLISGLAANANVNAGGFVTVLNNRIIGGLKLAGLTVDDAQYQYLENDSIADTRTDGLLSMQGNAVATTIVTQSVGVLVAGVWVIEETSQMTGTTAGRLTLDTVKDAKLPMTLSVSLAPVSGGSQTVGACFAINGVPISRSLRTTSASSGSPQSVTIPWQDTISPTDYVEVYVSNESGTTDVVASSAISRVN